MNPDRPADRRAGRAASPGVCHAIGRIALPVLWIALSGCEHTPAEREIHSAQVTEAGLRSINGTELHVKRMGSGPPVVVVHGGPVLEHGYLLPHLEPLARSNELIFFDQRLSGRSAGTVDSASVRLETFVADIEALRRSLGFQRIHLLGHSWGGLLAMRYAIAHSEHLSSLILVSPMSASAALWQEEERVLATRMTAADSIERAALLADPGLAERRPDAVRRMLLLSFGPQFHDRSRLGELELYVPDDYLERSRQFAFMTPDLTNYDFHEELERVAVPTLLIFGAGEPGRTIGGSALAARLPDVRLSVIADAGHFPFIEQPRAFLAVVRSFLDGHE
jgi:proline iminopeptidase